MSDLLEAPLDVSTDPALQSGAGLVGCILMYLTFGVLLSNFLRYLSNCIPAGSWYTAHAALVLLVTTMALCNLSFITYSVWRWVVLDTHIPPHLWIPPPTSLATPILNGMIAFCVQCFFVNKVWKLGSALKKPLLRIPGILIGILAGLHLTAAVALSIVFGIGGRIFTNAMDIVIACNLSTALAADLAITGSMIILLSHYKRRSSFSTTKQLLTTITRHTIENGLVPTVCALANVIAYYTRNDSVHLIFQWIIGNLYAIVLVVSLNRAHQASQSASTSQETSGAMYSISGGTVGLPLSQISQRNPISVVRTGGGGGRRKGNGRRTNSGPVQVEVMQQVEVEHDSGDDASLSAVAVQISRDEKASGRELEWEDERMLKRASNGPLYPSIAQKSG